MQERRTTIRNPWVRRAQYCPSKDLIPRDGCLTTLSAHGLGMLTHEPHPSGERITVSMTLPGADDVLTMTGVVRWCGDRPTRGRWYSLGLEWVPFEDATRCRLDTFLNQRFSWAPQRISDEIQQRPIVWWGGVVVGIVLVGRVMVLQWENAGMHHAVYQRNLVISQLEVRGERFEHDLELATKELSETLGHVEQLDQQTGRFQTQMQQLTHEVEQFQAASTKANDERLQLLRHVADLEEERAQMIHRLSTIPMVRQVIQDAIEARTRRSANPLHLEPR